MEFKIEKNTFNTDAYLCNSPREKKEFPWKTHDKHSHIIWNFSLWCVIKSFSTVNFIGLHKKIDYRMKIQI